MYIRYELKTYVIHGKAKHVCKFKRLHGWRKYRIVIS